MEKEMSVLAKMFAKCGSCPQRFWLYCHIIDNAEQGCFIELLELLHIYIYSRKFFDFLQL